MKTNGGGSASKAQSKGISREGKLRAKLK